MLLAARPYIPEPVAARAQGAPWYRSPGEGRWALVMLVAALVPALAAVWTVGWFIPQDAPAHAYNAQVLVWSFDTSSPFRDVFTVNWQPIPNWAGPLTMAGLVAVLPGWVADRIMTSLTLACFATAVVWLRWRVAGTRGLAVAALLATLLAMNMAWLYGFASFMLGACLFPITLGLWWPARDHLSVPRLTVLGLLLTLGYFCHLVSLGLTIGGLVVLATASPVPGDGESPWRHRFSRLTRTCTSFIPVALLGLRYLWIATQRAPLHPLWPNLADPWSPRAWVARLEWVDPLSLAIRDGLPFTERDGWAFIVFAPVIWLVISLAVWGYATIRAGLRAPGFDDRLGWLVLATILVVGGVLGPDSLGGAHGDYLPQRIILMGLVALVPVFDVDLSRAWGRSAAAGVLAAVVLQSAIVWDYAIYSDHAAGQIIRAGDLVGHGRRIAALLVTTRSRFRANPLLHAVDWLGVDTGNVVWNDYETLHYYFPVQFQPGIDRPRPDDLEWVSLHEAPADADARGREWTKILDQHAASIDVVVVWKSDPALDSITARWFDRVERRGDVQIFERGRSARN